MILHSDAIAALVYSSTIWSVLRNLGGVDLLLVGLTDGAVIPAPGATDALTILLAARHHEFWLYYAAMAAAGSVVGGSLTYRFGSVHGQATLIRKIGSKRTLILSQLFARWGFCAIAIPAMFPVPVSPFLLIAGATRYPGKRFVAALACGRSIKYVGLAFLASFYGKRLLTNVLSRYEGILFWLVVGIILVSVVLYRFAGQVEIDLPAAEEPGNRDHRAGDAKNIDHPGYDRIDLRHAETEAPGGIEPAW